MVLSRAILDEIVMCVIFNVTVALLFVLASNSFSQMLWAEIRRAAPKRTKREILLLANSLWLLILPLIYCMFLTVLMKHTEEKWLAKLHGKKYADYCRQVNRCIPSCSCHCLGMHVAVAQKKGE